MNPTTIHTCAMCGGRQKKKPRRPQQSAKSAAASPQHHKLQEALLCTKLSQQSTKFASCSIQACPTSISHNGISTSLTLIVPTKTLGSRNLKTASNSFHSKPWLNATYRKRNKINSALIHLLLAKPLVDSADLRTHFLEYQK